VEVERALLELQGEGSILQGRFSGEAIASGPTEWCERHLLMRIHRATLGRLRREIEPVEPRDFARFLFEWQHVTAASRVSGPEALAGVLAQLEGYEAPAGAWEAELLPARMTDYSPRWLDDLCSAGRTLWTRLRPVAAESRGGGASLRSTPVLLLPRRSARLWSALAPAAVADERVGARAQRVADFLAAHGASFFDDIASGVRLLRSELEDALAELVVRGLVHCDSYAGLRALLVPPSKRGSKSTVRRGRVAWFGIEDAGRWSLVRSRAAIDATPSAAGERVEHVARILLRRYGVVCWRLLEREPGWLPPWRELVRVYRRLEARGEIRGGRFVAGLSGEQYALPEAIALLREVRRRPRDGALVCVAAADPANLLGTVVPGDELPRVAGARVVSRDGMPLATSVGGEVAWLAEVAADERPLVLRSLARDPFARLDAAFAAGHSAASAAG
jgi:ATP-dependent Lhr-like helicase